MAILDQLVYQQILLQKARDLGFRVSDSQLQQVIAELPVFQENGRFSPERYRQVLAAQNMSPLFFEGRAAAGAAARAAAGSGRAGQHRRPRQRRALHQPARAAARGRRSPASTPSRSSRTSRSTTPRSRRSTTATPRRSRRPSRCASSTCCSSQDALAPQVAVDPAEVRKAYDENARQYTQPEERKAAHILIAVKPDAKDDEKAAARKKAEDLLAQAKAAPQRFAELAKANSQDPGSATAGRRSRQLPARHDGQDLRRRGVRDEAGRDRRAGAERVRLSRDPARRRDARAGRVRSRRRRRRSRPTSSGRRPRRSSPRRPSSSRTSSTSRPTRCRGRRRRSASR